MEMNKLYIMDLLNFKLYASNKRYNYSMKNILIILCLLFISATGSAQKFNIFKGDTINRTDAKGLKQGIWKKYYSNDVLFSEGVYKDGKHTGTFKTFYKSGKPQSILKFREMTLTESKTVSGFIMIVWEKNRQRSFTSKARKKGS